MSESRLMVSEIDRLSILNTLIPEVGKIGKDALDQRSRGLDVWKKSDGSMVTNVDLLVERALRDVLSELDPDGAIFGEEEGWSEHHPCDAAWVLDPIDGTRMFIEDRPGSSISVGFWSSEGAIAGIVHDLTRGVTYACDAASSIWLCPSPVSEPGRDIHGIWDLEREAQHDVERWILSGLDVGYEPDGCVLEMAAVAHGAKAGYVFATAGWAPFPWDLAAGAALLRTSGGALLWTDAPEGAITLQDRSMATLERYSTAGAGSSATLIALGPHILKKPSISNMLFIDPLN